jgi:hypothetical protein
MTKITTTIAKFNAAEAGRAKSGLLGPLTIAIKAILAKAVIDMTSDDRNDLTAVSELPLKAELLEAINARLTEINTPVVAKVRGRKLNPNSLRQTIVKVLAESPVPMTTKQIKEKLAESGVEINWLHSHIAYFKEEGQVVHGADKTYTLNKTMRERVAALGYEMATV